MPISEMKIYEKQKEAQIFKDEHERKTLDSDKKRKAKAQNELQQTRDIRSKREQFSNHFIVRQRIKKMLACSSLQGESY